MHASILHDMYKVILIINTTDSYGRVRIICIYAFGVRRVIIVIIKLICVSNNTPLICCHGNYFQYMKLKVFPTTQNGTSPTLILCHSQSLIIVVHYLTQFPVV